MYIGRIDDGEATAAGLIHAIIAFLDDQRLEPTPVNYGFAYRVLSEPAGALALEVARQIDGGVRLTGAEVARLGEMIEGAAAIDRAPEPDSPFLVAAAVCNCATAIEIAAAEARAEETLRQVAGFESMVSAMRSETHEFGRDLAASEDALRRSAPRATDVAIVELARITAAMRARVDVAEARLEQATREASDLRQQLAEAHDDARRDPLTDLPNRRAFEEALDDAGDGPFHVAICDVDHFKSINDQHGHAIGDRVLKAIGATLTRECGGHLVARYGGEEFTLLFAGIDAVTAQTLLERARRAVGERRYRLRESDTLIDGVTLSAGMVSIAPGETIVAAVERADALLYNAKRQGRNRAVGENGDIMVEVATIIAEITPSISE